VADFFESTLYIAGHISPNSTWLVISRLDTTRTTCPACRDVLVPTWPTTKKQ